MNKVYQVITDRFIEALEEGRIPWEKPWNAAGLMPRNAITGKAYSGVNVLILAMSEYDSPYWLTYKQAVKLGGGVKKGEKSTPVTFWKVMYFDTKTDEKLDKPKAMAWLKNPAKKSRVNTVPMLRYYNVFNFEQTEDIEDDKLPTIAEATTYEHQADEVSEAIIDSYMTREGIRLTDEASAFYVPASDRIGMPPKKTFKELPRYYCTFFHEMIHSTGHETRLKRELKGNMKSQSYSKEELTAEIGASFMMHHVGHLENTIENSKAYIKGWLSRLKGEDGATYIIHAAGRAEKATKFIIGEADSEKAEKVELAEA